MCSCADHIYAQLLLRSLNEEDTRAAPVQLPKQRVPQPAMALKSGGKVLNWVTRLLRIH